MYHLEKKCLSSLSRYNSFHQACWASSSRFHIPSPMSSSLNSRILSGSPYLFLLLAVTVLSCFVPFGHKPPAKAGTLASLLKRTQDIITDLGSKNDTPFAKCSALYCQFWVFQTPCSDSILSWPTVIWRDPIKNNFGVLLSNMSNKLRGLCVAGASSAAPSRVWDPFLCSSSWEVAKISQTRMHNVGVADPEGSPIAALQSNHKSLTATWLWRFTSPPSLWAQSSEQEGWLWWIKLSLRHFQSRAGSSLDGVQLEETAPAFQRTNSAAAMGTIPTPNPHWASIWVQETARGQRETSLLSRELHSVCFGIGNRSRIQQMPRWAEAQGRHLDSMFCLSWTVWAGKLTDLLITQCNGNNISEITVSFHLSRCWVMNLNSSATGFSKFLTLPLGHKSCYMKGHFWHKHLIFMITSLIQARLSLADHSSTVL